MAGPAAVNHRYGLQRCECVAVKTNTDTRSRHPTRATGWPLLARPGSLPKPTLTCHQHEKEQAAEEGHDGCELARGAQVWTASACLAGRRRYLAAVGRQIYAPRSPVRTSWQHHEPSGEGSRRPWTL